MKKIFALAVSSLFFLPAISQLFVEHGAGLYLQPGSALQVEGNLTSRDPISGAGVITLAGDNLQQVDLSGFSVENLVLHNSTGACLLSDIAINNSVLLKAGLLSCGSSTLILNQDAIISGIRSSYIETSGSGKIRKSLHADVDNFLIPLGNNGGYFPLSIQSKGKYANAFVDVSSVNRAHPQIPANTKKFINHYWTINRSGVDGTIGIEAVSDNETTEDMTPKYWSDHQWTERRSIPGSLNISIPEGVVELTAMSDNNQSTAASIFPNPANTRAYLKLTNAVPLSGRLDIVDVAGKIVQQQEIKLNAGINFVTLPIERLTKGIYQVRINSKQLCATQSLIRL